MGCVAICHYRALALSGHRVRPGGLDAAQKQGRAGTIPGQDEETVTMSTRRGFARIEVRPGEGGADATAFARELSEAIARHAQVPAPQYRGGAFVVGRL